MSKGGYKWAPQQRFHHEFNSGRRNDGALHSFDIVILAIGRTFGL